MKVKSYRQYWGFTVYLYPLTAVSCRQGVSVDLRARGDADPPQSTQLIRSIPRWSLTSKRAHCFLELVIIYRPYSCYTAAGVATYSLQVRLHREPSCYRVVTHTQLGTSSTMIILREVLHTACCCRYLLIWYCHLVQKMSPPYINL